MSTETDRLESNAHSGPMINRIAFVSRWAVTVASELFVEGSQS